MQIAVAELELSECCEDGEEMVVSEERRKGGAGSSESTGYL